MNIEDDEVKTNCSFGLFFIFNRSSMYDQFDDTGNRFICSENFIYFYYINLTKELKLVIALTPF